MKAHKTDSADMSEIAVKAITGKKGGDIAEFDVSGSSPITDRVIIVSGMNAPHLKALVNATVIEMKKEGYQCYRRSGDPNSGWIIADYLDIMIHFFVPEQREYYGLDRLFKN